MGLTLVSESFQIFAVTCVEKFVRLSVCHVDFDCFR